MQLLASLLYISSTWLVFVQGLHVEKLHQDSSWDLINGNATVAVPNISALNTHLALIEDGVLQGNPYYRDNELRWGWVALDTWKYATSWKSTSEMLSHSDTVIRCQIDTVAMVKVNGVLVGNTTSMHQTYDFDARHLLRPLGHDNHIEVIILPAMEYALAEAKKYPYPVPESVYYGTWTEGSQPDNEGWGNGTYTHRNFVRKIASDFGWDWGPAFVPSGIMQFEVVSRHVATLDTVTVNQRHNNNNSVTLLVNAHVDAVLAGNVQLTSGVSQGVSLKQTSTRLFDVKVGENLLKIELEIVDPKLWWPVGHGEAYLYDLEVKLDASKPSIADMNAERSKISKKIGLRTVELVTDPLPGGHSFFFRINGVDIYAKGSNFIPADVFQPRAEKDLEWILRSAVDANMNMVRVWGGGMYQVDKFYDMADKMGIMIWQEMMFACALYSRHKEFLASITVELTQQARRLQHHASIVIWGGNNENELAMKWYAASRANRDLYVVDYNALYVDTARAALIAVDDQVPFIDSSPSNGLVSSEPFVKRWGDPTDVHYGDVHYYNYGADCEDHTTYPKPRFVSEHGFQSFPSFEEYKEVLAEGDWSHNSSQLFYRQRHQNGQQQIQTMLERHFRIPGEFAKQGESQQQLFDDYLYLTQVQQSRCYETAFAQWRRLRSDPGVNTMGILYWQLNDIWQGPSWSSIEHSGRWRLTHSAVQRSFEPVMVSMTVEDDALRTFVTSDLTKSVLVTLGIHVHQVDSPLNVDKHHVYPCAVSALAGTFECPILKVSKLLQSANCSISNCFIVARGSTDETEPRKLMAHAFLTPMKNFDLPISSGTISGMHAVGNRVARFNVTANATAAFATLQSIIVGRFVPNGILMFCGESVEVEFVAREDFDLNHFSRSLSFRSLRDTYELEGITDVPIEYSALPDAAIDVHQLKNNVDGMGKCANIIAAVVGNIILVIVLNRMAVKRSCRGHHRHESYNAIVDENNEDEKGY